MPACPRCKSQENQREHTAYGDWSRCLKCQIRYAPTPNPNIPAEPRPDNALKCFQFKNDPSGFDISWQAPAPGLYRITGSITACFGALFAGGGFFLPHWSYGLIGLLFGGLMLWIGLDQWRKGLNTHQLRISAEGKLTIQTGPWPQRGYPCEIQAGQALFCKAFKQAQVSQFYLYAHQQGKDIQLTPAELESPEQAFWLLQQCQQGVKI